MANIQLNIVENIGMSGYDRVIKRVKIYSLRHNENDVT